jgi:hypothetical protein
MSIKDNLQAGLARAGEALPDALMVSGAAGVSFGAGMVFQPAGYIVAGLFALAGGWLLARGGK